MKNLLVLLLLWLPHTCLSENDSTKLSLSDFLSVVSLNHPVSKQAKLVGEEKRFLLQVARGSFDPTVSGIIERKELNGIEYFTHQDYFLKVPLLPGIDIQSGYENNTGQYLNPESITPGEGLFYAGVSVPLGRGLIFDERRNALQQARLAGKLSEARQVEMANKVLLDAIYRYADWYVTYRSLQQRQYAVELAEFRLQATGVRIREGDAAVIDSVEALLELEKRKGDLIDAQNDFAASTLLLSAYLWSAEGSPLQLSPGVLPMDSLPVSALILPAEAQQLEMLLNDNPALLRQAARVGQLEMDRKLYREFLKPRINATYNILHSGSPGGYELQAAKLSNYKFGVTVNAPLFLRKERGNLSLMSVRLRQGRFEMQALERDLEARLSASNVSFNNLQKQLSVQRQVLAAAETLRNGEMRKFQNGESTLFMVNTRETRLIEAQLKLVELEGKILKAHSEARFLTSSLVR